jgi:hypothetical protein
VWVSVPARVLQLAPRLAQPWVLRLAPELEQVRELALRPVLAQEPARQQVPRALRA